jgi:hypothetical protein
MKLAFRLLVCGLIVVIGEGLAVRGGATPAAPQATGGPTVTGDLLKDWTAQESTLMLIADAMPADKFGYKPTVIQRSYGEQIMHVAQTNVDLLKLMDGKAAVPEFTADSAKSKAEVLKALSDSYDYGTALLKEQTDTTVSQVVRAPAFVGTGAGAIFLGPSTRARIFWFLLGHSMDIYGQMAVYLRLNGVVPPASRG